MQDDLRMWFFLQNEVLENMVRDLTLKYNGKSAKIKAFYAEYPRDVVIDSFFFEDNALQVTVYDVAYDSYEKYMAYQLL